MKPLLVDLFCGAGGAGMGYARAGFEVVGVDINPQPRYPFPFIQADALTFPLAGFDAVHASPPCQAHTALRKMWNARPHLDLIPQTRARLVASGLPYVIENVPGAPLLEHIVLCGSMFRLGCAGAELRRHRWFESSFPIPLPGPCAHNWLPTTVEVYGHSGGSSTRAKARAAVIGVYGGHGRDRRRMMNTQFFTTAERREAMGIDWMTGAELSQAIPPAYTEHIGRYLMEVVRERSKGLEEAVW